MIKHLLAFCFHLLVRQSLLFLHIFFCSSNCLQNPKNINTETSRQEIKRPSFSSLLLFLVFFYGMLEREQLYISSYSNMDTHAAISGCEHRTCVHKLSSYYEGKK